LFIFSLPGFNNALLNHSHPNVSLLVAPDISPNQFPAFDPDIRETVCATPFMYKNEVVPLDCTTTEMVAPATSVLLPSKRSNAPPFTFLVPNSRRGKLPNGADEYRCEIQKNESLPAVFGANPIIPDLLPSVGNTIGVSRNAKHPCVFPANEGLSM